MTQLAIQDIRDDLKDKAEEMRAKMIEIVVEQDDDVMEQFLEGEEPDEITIKRLIRKGTLAMDFVAVMCGSAFKNKGVQFLLDAVPSLPWLKVIFWGVFDSLLNSIWVFIISSLFIFLYPPLFSIVSGFFLFFI